jgi:transcriptional regulator with XRE-family HTH domain
MRELRRDRQLTQREVAQRARLPVSYLSRLETGRITPTVATAGRVARALDVELSELFRADRVAVVPGHRCPVSSSGECIGRLIRDRGGRPRGARKARYGEAELRLLRMADYLLLHGRPDVRAALATMLEALMARSGG